MSEVFDAARRIDLLLKDEAVQAALAAMKQAYYTEFLTAKDNEGRVMAQAKAQVLDTFGAALRAVLDAGERETTEQERRDRAPTARTF